MTIFSLYRTWNNGDNLTGPDLTATFTQLLANLESLQIHGRCRLVRVNTTTIRLDPYSGNNLLVKTSSGWTIAAVPAAGVTGTTAGLAATTLYYVYVFDNVGTLTLEFSATGHSTDTDTGVEIKTGDPTRTLVGMVRTSGATTFLTDDTLWGVISWFNRRGISVTNNFSTSRSTSSTTYVELNSEIRGNFLTWGDEAVMVGINGVVANDGANNNFTSVGFDGTNQEKAVEISTGTANYPIGLILAKQGLAEGFHYATLLGAVSAGSGTWYGTTFVADTTVRSITTLTVKFQG